MTAARIREDLAPYEGLRWITALRVGKVPGRYKVGKDFQLAIGDDHFHWQRDKAKIAEEAALDGLYVLRTDVPAA